MVVKASYLLTNYSLYYTMTKATFEHYFGSFNTVLLINSSRDKKSLHGNNSSESEDDFSWQVEIINMSSSKQALLFRPILVYWNPLI